MKPGYIENPASRFEHSTVTVYKTAVPYPQAELAERLIHHFGVVAAATDGEDSAGRAKLKLLSPEEVVARACQIAELAHLEFQKRDWLLKLPALSPKLPAPDKPPAA